VKNIFIYFIPIFISFLPLIFSFNTPDPVLSIRFFAISLVMTIFCGLQLLANKKVYKSIFKNIIIRLYLVIFFIYGCSLLYNGFSPNSLYEISKILLFIIFLILIINNIFNYGYKYLILSVITFSFLISSLYFIQYFSGHSQIVNFDKIASTMGHKNLLVSIHFLCLPFLIYAIFRYKNFWRFFSIISIIMVFVIFKLVESRAIILALTIFFISLFFVYRSFIFKSKIIKWLIPITIIVSGVFFLIPNPDNKTDTLSNKIQRTLNFQESPRYNLFLSSIKLINDNPILGVGPGNWKISIPLYGLYDNPKLETQYTRGESFAQRPHNDFLWIASEGGIFTGFLYIIIFMILIKKSYDLSRKKEKSQSLLFALLFSTLLGYFMISFFDFPFERISHNIIFSLISAIIISSSINNSIKECYKSSIPIILFFPLLFFITILGYNRYKGQVSMKKIEEYKRLQNWSGMINEVDKGYHPLFFNTSNTSTPLHWYSGLAFFNKNKLNNAFLDFKKAYKINPNHVHVINNLATSHEMRKNSNKAINLYKEGLKIMPTFKESAVNLAAIYFNQKKFTASLDAILSCNPPPYKERILINDNYDIYLKKIFFKYVSSVKNQASEEQKIKLRLLLDKFDSIPGDAGYIMKQVYDLRIDDALTYLEAIYLYK